MTASKAQRTDTAARRAQAIQMRLAGLTYDVIAQRLKYSSRQAAAKDIERALAVALRDANRSAEEFREVELMRLDRLQAAAWATAIQGDPRAIHACLQVIDRRCKLLGLDAPQRHEVLTIDTLDAAIRDLEAELADDPAPDLIEP